MRSRITLPVLLPVVLAALLLMAGCGSGSHASHASHDSADVEFATQMIPHHRQAVTMAKLVAGKGADPAVTKLAATIEAAQAPEITKMSGWLRSWGEKVPSTGSMSGMSHHDMPGMMSAADMTSLRTLTGAAFDEKWLTMMIEHHQGALTMARTEVKKGESKAAVALARSIIDSQSEQITQMKAALAAG
ncbi:DUF305 domain-containing protein [Nocardioides mangrovicus]|uniref:DUF305 domain-containing protein n=1 Tax=Nocardioides mangrovicus TaxID=2478913 RepID=A0A3L8NYJ3_9ACTN|nr:DUF305 domain-containing protein [Nocardioides mangrovicus]RLV48235.1 DUF305 domain-containing protein [Nocardioides mangrovicus]